MNTTSNEVQTEGKIQVNLMSYKLLGKHRTLMKGSLISLKGSRIKLERVTKTEITCVVSFLSFLPLTKKRLR